MKNFITPLFILALVAPMLAIAESNTPAAVVAKAEGRIDINSANAQQLTELKGIGLKKAQAIIEYRNSHGPFKALSDLTNVKGIGDKFVEKNAQYMKL
ncbi:ComEA family DNA-binding protein [Thalassotalea maritima]|uniref:ComEA family DNA-binding protein n=1 Tax=Thalassotalea maritima TaxID=3242416 RepID=UPI0035281CEA